MAKAFMSLSSAARVRVARWGSAICARQAVCRHRTSCHGNVRINITNGLGEVRRRKQSKTFGMCLLHPRTDALPAELQAVWS